MVNDLSHAVQNADLIEHDDQTHSFDAVDNDVGDYFLNAAPPLLTTAEVFPCEPFMFTTDQKWTIALLKILDDINAPDYAFTDVLSC